MLEEKRGLSALNRQPDVEKKPQESGESQTLLRESDSPMNSGRTSSEFQNDKNDLHDTFKETSLPTFIDPEHVTGRVDNPCIQSQAVKDNKGVNKFCQGKSPTVQANSSADAYSSSLLVKQKIMPIAPITGKDIKCTNFNCVGPTQSHPGTL